MSPTIPPLRVLTIPGPALSPDAIEAIARQISTEPAAVSAPIVIDCHNVRDVAPSGLSVLLDLRADHEDTRFVLVALSRQMLAAALELGLAERFTICRSAEAATRVLAEEAG